MTRPARPPQAGFTLLEVLVSLLILGLLMAGLAQGVQFGIRAWNNQSAFVARNADLDSADRTLRTLITRMKPPAEPDKPSVIGRADGMDFTSDLPAGAPIDPPRTAAMTLLVDRAHHLVLRWMPQPHAALLGPRPATHDQVLLDGVAGLQMGYRDRTGGWTTSWSAATLPQLVRIHIVFTTAQRWPEILIAPMRDSISETGE